MTKHSDDKDRILDMIDKSRRLCSSCVHFVKKPASVVGEGYGICRKFVLKTRMDSYLDCWEDPNG